MYSPNYIKDFEIYDVFFNDCDNYILIGPYEKIYKIKFIYEKNEYEFSIKKCDHGHTLVYFLSNYPYFKRIKIKIDEVFLEIDVNRYPSLSREILMSTIVRNEDNYVIQWIEYHLILGVQRFIIYDNSKYKNDLIHKKNEIKGDLNNLLSHFIEKGIVILIDWGYPYKLKKSGISGQTTQQNHSIYAFKRSKLIGMLDIDEYVNPQYPYVNISYVFNQVLKEKNKKLSDIGGFSLSCKLFFNCEKKSEIGYNFLEIFNCKSFSNDREKVFIYPKNVHIHSVHAIVSGIEPIYIKHDIMYFNHYFFLNKKDRGREMAEFNDTSIMRIAKKLFIKYE